MLDLENESMLSDPAFWLWKNEARRRQGEFFKNLLKVGEYHPFKSPWAVDLSDERAKRRMINLERKIGYGFFGMPKCKVASSTGYDEDETSFIQKIVKMIEKTKKNRETEIELAFVMILCQCQKGETCLPVMRFRNEELNADNFYAWNGQCYASWDILLVALPEQNYNYCYPDNGVYENEEENIVFLQKKSEVMTDMPEEDTFVRREIPDLLDPIHMELTRKDVFRICSSILFFFNIFYDEGFDEPKNTGDPEDSETISLWNALEKSIDFVLNTIKSRLSPEDISYWDQNWGEALKEKPKLKAYVLKSLGEMDVEDFIQKARNVGVTMECKKGGIVSLNKQVLISPAKIREFKEDSTIWWNIIRGSEDEKTRTVFAKNHELLFEKNKREMEDAIWNILDNDRNFNSFKDIKINDLVVSKNIKNYQLEGLYKVLTESCKGASTHWPDICLNLIHNQSFRTVEDMYNTLGCKMALIYIMRRDMEADYKRSEQEGTLNNRFSIPKGCKRRLYFLSEIIKRNLGNDSELNKSFKELKAICFEENERNELKFGSASAAAGHQSKHGQPKGLSPQEYFEKIQDLNEKCLMQGEDGERTGDHWEKTEYVVQEGDARKTIFKCDDWVLIFFERMRTTPEGAIEPVRILATIYPDTKSKEANANKQNLEEILES